MVFLLCLDDVELVEEEEEEVVINEPEQMVVQSELAHEIEIETEEPPEDTSVKVALPPLRPLTIAPKPTKVPVSFSTKAGQYIVVQGKPTYYNVHISLTTTKWHKGKQV